MHAQIRFGDSSRDTKLATTVDKETLQQVPLHCFSIPLSCSSLGERMKEGKGYICQPDYIVK